MTVKRHAERVRPNARQVRETLMRIVFLVTACISILAVILICIFMFANGIPTIAEIGPANFLLGTKWKPLNGIFGILPMIVGSLYVTAGAILIGVPVGILCAVYLAHFCSKRLYRVLKPLIDLLAGIPSIVYGFFGLVVIVPLIQQLTGGSNGKNILTASLMLGIMIPVSYTHLARADDDHIVERGGRRFKVALEIKPVQRFTGAPIEKIHVPCGVALHHIAIAIVVIKNQRGGPCIRAEVFLPNLRSVRLVVGDEEAARLGFGRHRIGDVNKVGKVALAKRSCILYAAGHI